MSAARLLREARAAGVKLGVSPSGKLSYRGPPEPVQRLLPALAEHRDQLLATLRAESDKPAMTVPAGADPFETAAELIRLARSNATPGRRYQFRLVDEREADRRNAAAARDGITDRFCCCGHLATFAWPGNDGRDVWICNECASTRGRA